MSSSLRSKKLPINSETSSFFCVFYMDTPDWERIKTILHFFKEKKMESPSVYYYSNFEGFLSVLPLRGRKRRKLSASARGSQKFSSRVESPMMKCNGSLEQQVAEARPAHRP